MYGAHDEMMMPSTPWQDRTGPAVMENPHCHTGGGCAGPSRVTAGPSIHRFINIYINIYIYIYINNANFKVEL